MPKLRRRATVMIQEEVKRIKKVCDNVSRIDPIKVDKIVRERKGQIGFKYSDRDRYKLSYPDF